MPPWIEREVIAEYLLDVRGRNDGSLLPGSPEAKVSAATALEAVVKKSLGKLL